MDSCGTTCAVASGYDVETGWRPRPSHRQIGPDPPPEARMPRTVKVFLPRWIRWLILPVLLLIWGVITYATFVEAGPERMGFVPWLAVTVILIVIGVMLWLMT